MASAFYIDVFESCTYLVNEPFLWFELVRYLIKYIQYKTFYFAIFNTRDQPSCCSV